MARRTGGSASRSARRPTHGRPTSTSRSSFWSRAFVVLVMLIFGAIVLERAGWLPERASAVVRQLEAGLELMLREAGLELPPRSDPDLRPFPNAPTDPSSDDRIAAAAALVLLDRLVVTPERPRGYDRGAWPHWLDADGDCQDARQEVLLAESLERARLTSDGCRVVSGLWRDAYTGESTQDPSTLDVDHMVPLAEAWRSGGLDWDAERRAAYANDLADGRALIAVSASANRSKGDQGPEEWLPPLTAARCRYVADWVAVKARWGLSLDERERVSVGNVLRACAAP